MIIERVIDVPPGAQVMMTVNGKVIPDTIIAIPAGKRRIYVRIKSER
jgi:hypothetical protein